MAIPRMVATCEICEAAHRTEACSLVNPVVRVQDTPLPLKARLTLPNVLELVYATYDHETGVATHKMMVVARAKIPKGAQFGPLDAPKSTEFNADCAYKLKIFESKEMSYFFDTTSEKLCNWMTLVPFGDDGSEINCLCYQYEDEIYFTSIKEIEIGHSLCVGYAPGYEAKLKEDLTKTLVAAPTTEPSRQHPPLRTYKSATKKRAVSGTNTYNEERRSEDHDYSIGENQGTRSSQDVDYSPSSITIATSASESNNEMGTFTFSTSQFNFNDPTTITFHNGNPATCDTAEEQLQEHQELEPIDDPLKDASEVILSPLEKYKLKKYPVLAIDIWKCKFCDFEETSIPEFANHLIQHYKSVGAARTEKARLQKQIGDGLPYGEEFQTHDMSIGAEEVVGGQRCLYGSTDTKLFHSGEAETEFQKIHLTSAESILQPKYPYVCDICAQKKIFNRAEYLARHLRYHLEDSTVSSDDSEFSPDGLEHPMKKKTFLCTECCTELESEKEYHVHVQKNHFKPLNCVTCQRAFTTHLEYIAHKCTKNSVSSESVSSVFNPHACALCEQSFSTPKELNAHVRGHGDDFSCGTCGKLLKNRDFRSHQGICETVNEFVSGLSTCLQCPNCGKTCTTMTSFCKHMSLHTHPGKCPTCCKRFSVATSSKSHKCSKFECDRCHVNFDTFGQFQKHLYTEHHELNYYCFECAMPFATKEAFVNHKGCQPPKHLLGHSAIVSQKKTRKQWGGREEGMFVCEICGAIYAKWSSLKTHRSVHGPKRFKCSLCPKEFHRKEMLADHEFVHQEAQFKCEICDKKLKSKKSLDVHKMIHSGEKKYKCTVCEKAFFQKVNLENHRLTHLPLEEKGYVCVHCNKKFSSKEYLGFHVEEHLAGRKEVCPICGKRFIKRHMLNQHMKTIHSNVKYTCEFCHTSMRQKHSLFRHLNKRHGDIREQWDKQGYAESRSQPLQQTQDTEDTNLESVHTFTKTENTEENITIVYADDVEMEGHSYMTQSGVVGMNDVKIESQEITISEDMIISESNIQGGDMVLVDVVGGAIFFHLASDLECDGSEGMEGVIVDNVDGLQL